VASPLLVLALTAAVGALAGSTTELNRLDGYAGDGDMGITMGEVARALGEVLDADYQVATGQLLQSCGATVARRAPSTSGTLIATGFLRAAKAVGDVAEGPRSDVEVVDRAFRAALDGIQARGKASVGDRTLVDGLDAVCTSLHESAAIGRVLPEGLQLAAHAAEGAAEATVSMSPRVGRASWVPDRAIGHADAGCTMLAIVMRAAATGLAQPDPASPEAGPA
jgi:phosphoenolpyruvate---glycerone phosphotransferase subunit DhaL